MRWPSSLLEDVTGCLGHMEERSAREMQVLQVDFKSQKAKFVMVITACYIYTSEILYLTYREWSEGCQQEWPISS